MTPTPEQIAAFADDELEGAARATVEAAVAADPALQAQVAAHRALRARLGAHFAPVVDQPVPDRLAALLSPPPATPVVDLAQARAGRRAVPRWTWLAAPALAASLVLAVVLDPPGGPGPGYADERLAAALQEQLVAEQPADAPVRVLLSFRDRAGAYCRAFASTRQTGIACRDEAGWKLHAAQVAEERSPGEYRQAGSEAEIMQAAQAMAAGPALDAVAERAARAGGWGGR